MADKGSNATAVTWGSALASVQSVQVQIDGAEVDITALDSTRHEVLDGFDNLTATLTFVGADAGGLSKGDTDDLSVAWNDGTADTFSDCIVLNVGRNASKDAPLTSTATIKYTEATGS